MSQRYQAVIFDLDGVITDTAHFHFLAWRELAHPLGLPFDEAFNEKVKNRQEGFFAGDTLRVRLRTNQRLLKDNKLDTSYTVVRVIEHIHAPQPRQLPLSDSSELPQRRIKLPKPDK